MRSDGIQYQLEYMLELGSIREPSEPYATSHGITIVVKTSGDAP